MFGKRLPACSCSVAVLIGVESGLRLQWCPPAFAVLLLALGLCLREDWGRLGVSLALGLLAGALQREPDLPWDVERPVVLTARRLGPWRHEEFGVSAPATGEWLRQGRAVTRWRQRVLVSLPDRPIPPPAIRFRLQGYLKRAPAPANGVGGRPGRWTLRAKSWAFFHPEPASSTLTAWHRASSWLRMLVDRRLVAGGGEAAGEGRRMVEALVLGRADELPKAWRRGLRAAGLAHLTALSGLHVGLVAGAGFLLTSAAPRTVRLLLIVGLLSCYLLLAGPRPSLIRATLMLAAIGGSWWLGRPPQPLNSLAWVAAAMVLTAPELVRDVGFQLTFSATLGILLFAPRLRQRWQRVPAAARAPLSVSVAAQLGALPYTLSTFHLLTPLAPLWNLVAVPWTALSLIVFVGWTVVLIAVPGLAWLARPLIDLLAAPYAWPSLLGPEVLLPIPVSLSWWPALAVALLLAFAALSGGILLRAGAMALALALIFLPGASSRHPELMLLDVGQGEAILLRDGDAAALVDGGGWRRSDIAQRILLPVLSGHGLRRLDAVFLTHPDQDHCGGLVDLSSYLIIDRVVTAPGWRQAPCVSELLTRPGPAVQAMWRGEVARIGRWRLEALHPGAGDRGGRNDRSLVLLAEVPGHRVLLTGDLESLGEHELLARAADRLERIEILKIAHHGSNTSSSIRWLSRLRPRLALISCGVANRYHHPSPLVLQRLRALGIPTLRTDLQGAVRIVLPPSEPLRVELPGEPRDRPG